MKKRSSSVHDSSGQDFRFGFSADTSNWRTCGIDYIGYLVGRQLFLYDSRAICVWARTRRICRNLEPQEMSFSELPPGRPFQKRPPILHRDHRFPSVVFRFSLTTANRRSAPLQRGPRHACFLACWGGAGRAPVFEVCARKFRLGGRSSLCIRNRVIL